MSSDYVTAETRKLLKQFVRFGGVGLTATALHSALYAGLTALFGILPIVANVVAFSIAFGLSFHGHFHWTFGDSGDSRRTKSAAMPRFLVASGLGLGLNSLIVFLVVNVWDISYLYAVIGFIFVTPPFLFLINRFWAFHTPSAGGTD